MKKLTAFTVALFALALAAVAAESAFEPLLIRMVIKYPDSLNTSHVQGVSTSECNAVLYDARGYFAIKKEEACVKAYENAEFAKAYDNIGFAFENPELSEEPFFYDSEWVENDRVKDAGNYYTFYITPKFMGEHKALQNEFNRVLKPFGGALTPEQITEALDQAQKPAKDRGFHSFQNS